MISRNWRKQKGVGIIEVILALALVAVIVVVIGRVLISIQKIYKASELRNEAYLYAQQPLEIINEYKNDFFGCSCGGSCSTCSSLDGQSCTVVEPYQSCWTQYPTYFNLVTTFYLSESGGVWSLNELSGGALETVPENNFFSRQITITNGENLDGDTEDNIKNITVEVFWTDKGIIKSISLTSVLTAWEAF